jgi:hypothetical protein
VEGAADLALAHGPIGVKRLLQLAERAVAAEAFERGAIVGEGEVGEGEVGEGEVGEGEVGEGATASAGVADGAAILDAVRRYADQTLSVPFADCDIKS